MQVSAVDFAERTTGPRRALVVAATAIWLSVGALAALAWRHDADARQLAVAVKIDAIPAKARPPLPTDAAKGAKRYAKEAEQAARQAGFPLNDILAAIEGAPGPAVTLSKIQASAEARSASVEVSSDSLEAVIAYTAALNTATRSGAWSLGAVETMGPSALLTTTPSPGKVHATLTWSGKE